MRRLAGPSKPVRLRRSERLSGWRVVGVDRFMLPPAVVAAVFTVLAIAPPVAMGPRAGLRVEAVGPLSAGARVSLRAVAERLSDGAWEPLSAPARVRLRGADGQVTEARFEPPAAGLWSLAHVTAPTHLPVAFTLDDAPLAAAPRQGWSMRVGPVTTRVDPRVAVLEGVMASGLPATLLVEAQPGTRVRVPSDNAAVTATPEEAVADPSGFARLTVTVEALGAVLPIACARPDGVTERFDFRPDLRPGAAVLGPDPDTLWAASAEGEVWLVWGTGPRVDGLAVRPLVADAEQHGRATFAEAHGASWAVAARSGTFEDPVRLPRGLSPREQCRNETRCLALATQGEAPLQIPHEIVWNSRPWHAAHARAAVTRARGVCLAVVLLAILAEALLVFSGQFGPVSSELRPMLQSGRARLGWALAAALVLASMAGALLLTVSVAR